MCMVLMLQQQHPADWTTPCWPSAAGLPQLQQTPHRADMNGGQPDEGTARMAMQLADAASAAAKRAVAEAPPLSQARSPLPSQQWVGPGRQCTAHITRCAAAAGTL